MRRFSLILLFLCITASIGGCRGANNNFALFSPNSTRVPAPGTKSYGAPDSNYYPKSSQAAPGAGSDLAAPSTERQLAGEASASGRSSLELTWQPPRPKSDRGRGSVANEVDAKSDNIVQAGFTDLTERSGGRAEKSPESPVRVVENSAPSSYASRIRGMNASEAKQPAGPLRVPDPGDAVEISQLPRVTSGAAPPKVRIPGSTIVPSPAGPEPMGPAADGPLGWRSRS